MGFPHTLQQLRKEHGLSQEKLAEVIGVSRQAAAKWESGESTPELDKLVALSDYFKLGIDRLVRDADPGCPPGPAAAALPDQTAAIAFLCRAKKATYAGKGAETSPTRPASHDLQYREGDFLYHDSYLGGERFAGGEALWQAGIPFWTMNYVGRSLDSSFSGNFLKECLSLVPPERPFRGPAIHSAGDYIYHCRVAGDFGWFEGREEIFCLGRLVYECLFHGGSVR